MKKLFIKNISYLILLISFSPILFCCSRKEDIPKKIEYVDTQLIGEKNNQVLVIKNVFSEKIETKLDVETKSGKKFSRELQLSPGEQQEFGRYKIGMRWEKGDKYTITIKDGVKGSNIINGKCE